MALTGEQTRKVYEYLRVLQVSAVGSLLGGVPVLTLQTHLVQTAVNELTSNGETTVVSILGTMDALRSQMSAPSAARGLKRVKGGSSEIEFQDDEGGFASLTKNWEWWRRELASVLGINLAEIDAPTGVREP